jgi:hypothetical protein
MDVESAERELAMVVAHYRGHLHHALEAFSDKLLRSKLPTLPEALEAILAACYEVDRRRRNS